MCEGSEFSTNRDAGFFYAGNLVPRRDIRYAADTLGESMHCTVAGQGLLAEAYEALNVRPNFDMRGFVTPAEVEQLTKSCFAVLALYDTSFKNNRLATPNKLFEAMKFGKPCIVSDGTVMADIVREQQCGIAVPYGDAEAFKQAVDRLMDEAEYTKMAENAFRSYHERYKWEVMFDRLVAAYKNL
jgi:glycosyltransferase involved in cell wall biosynthesis